MKELLKKFLLFTIQFVFFFFCVILDIDKPATQMVLNDVAIFTHFERKRERGMTKWIDQSVLDATINRRRYFPLFRHFASRFDPTRTRFALSRVSPFIFSLTVIIPPTLCSGHQRARRFSARKAKADGRTGCVGGGGRYKGGSNYNRCGD